MSSSRAISRIRSFGSCWSCFSGRATRYRTSSSSIPKNHSSLIPEDARISVTHIRKDQFDHGASRNLGVSKSDAELFLMMTEDAVPKDTTLVERLVRVFETDPYKDAAPVPASADDTALLGETDTADGYADGDIGHGKAARGPIGAVYGRQLATQESSYDEQYARQFNYPAQSFVKTQQDIARLGIKTYFESNVCCSAAQSSPSG